MPDTLKMKSLVKGASGFLREQDGPTACEYAVLLALILLSSIAAIRLHGCKLKFMYRNIENGLPAGV